MASIKLLGAPEYTAEERKALIDFVFDLRKSYIQEFLARAELPKSGTRPDLRDRVQEALEEGHLTYEQLVDLLDTAAPWGKQHVLLYTGPRSNLQLWKDSDHFREHLNHHRLGKLLNCRLPLILPERLTLSSIMHADGRLRLTAVQRREYTERSPEHDKLTETVASEKITYRAYKQTIGERFEKDRAALLPLPAAPYEACDKRPGRVSSLSLVRYRGNDYSVPVCWGHRAVLVKGYVHEVVISCGAEVIARHVRSYEREDLIFDPPHYLALLEQKTNALGQAAPLVGWELPEPFAELRRLLETRLLKRGKREYVQVLRLLETFSMAEVARAVEDALRLRAISFDAVQHLLLCRIEQRPPRLDLENYSHLPLAQVATTAASDYLALLTPTVLREGVR